MAIKSLTNSLINLLSFRRATAVVSLALGIFFFLSDSSDARSPYGGLEHEFHSEYSHVRIRRKNSLRTMLFVRDTKEEVVESIVDLNQPSKLLVPYTRFMFLSYAVRPKQEKVLIVGLGGGSMVHFLRHYDPKLLIDVVEIDPKIVNIADQYFDVRSDANVNIMAADGLDFLSKTTEKYDVIYMDAFLKPSVKTDTTGVPLAMKTAQFYQQIQTTLKPDGLVAFNLNPHYRTAEDVAAIKNAFPQVYTFSMPRGSGHVAIASMTSNPQLLSTTIDQAKQIDARFKTPYSFEKMARRMLR